MTASTESLRAIIAKADEKLMAARRDLESGFPGEASSRAYYAAFHAMTAILAVRGLSFSSHMQTIGAFNREFVKSGIFAPETTRQIQRLFDDRQTADYDWIISVDKQTASEDVTNAEALVKACRSFIEQHTSS